MAQLPTVRELDVEASTHLFAALLERYPRYVHIGMAKPDGTFLASGLTRPPRPTGTVADRAWFQRALKAGDFSIGDYQIDRFTGKPVVAFGYPVLDSKRETVAVLGLALDLAWLNQFVNEAELPTGSLLMAVDSRGTVLAHSLDPDRWVGKQFLHASPSQPAPEEKRQFSVVESTGMDGVRRLYSFVRLPGPEGEPTAFVSLGISSSVVNRNADRKLWRDLLWLGLAGACTLVAASVGSRALILNAVSALVGAAGRMTAGDLSSRSGLKYGSGEIGKLAQAFDEMAKALERRIAEIEHSNVERERLLKGERAARAEAEAAQSQLRDSGEQLRALSTHLESIREEERTRIAREIHDELGQALTGLKMDVSWLRDRLQRGDLDTDILSQKTEAMSQLIDTTVQSVRRIATELRPGILDDLGIVAAVEWLAQDFESRTGIRCNFAADCEEINLDRDRATALFRISQETLTNVARHSSASAVNISLKQENSSLILQISDNGRGITRDEAAGARSLGLLGMRERATSLGGRVDIEGAPGKGTLVTAHIPRES
jgi:signal transduction histidine kinase